MVRHTGNKRRIEEMGYSLSPLRIDKALTLVRKYNYNVTEASSGVFFNIPWKVTEARNITDAQIRDDNQAVYLRFKDNAFAVIENPMEANKWIQNKQKRY